MRRSKSGGLDADSRRFSQFSCSGGVLWPVIRPVRPLIGMCSLRWGGLVFRAEYGPLIRRWTMILGRRGTVPLRRRGAVPRIVVVIGTIDAAACQQKRRHEQRKKLYPFHVPSRWMAVPIKNNTGGSTRQALRCERAANGRTAGAGTNGVGRQRRKKAGRSPPLAQTLTLMRREVYFFTSV